MNRLLLLHTTCCYLRDTVSTVCEMQNHPLFAQTEFHHALVDQGVCTYSYQLPAPADIHCRNTNEAALCYLRGGKGKLHTFKDFLREKPEAPFDKDSFQITSLQHIVYKNLKLWEVVKPSVAAYLQWESVNRRLKAISLKEFTCLKEFLYEAIRYVDASERLLAEIQPTHCIIFNGHFYRERIVLELCRRQAIAVLAVESSTFKNLKHFSQTGIVGNCNDWALLGDDWSRTRRLNKAEKGRLDQFMYRQFAGDGNFITQPVRNAGVRKRLKIAEHAQVALFLAQVPHDSVITSNDLAFCDLPGAIELLLAEFKSTFSEVVLVIRLHPGGDVTSLRTDYLARWLLPMQWPPNVRLIVGTTENTYDLMEAADFGITFSSQAGLEFLWLHKPLIVLGNAYYGNKGFTWDVKSAKELVDALRLIPTNGMLSAAQKDKIDVFLFGLIFEYLVPFSRDTGLLSERGHQMVFNLLTGRSRLFGVTQSTMYQPYDSVE